jgi:hypothetical protein
MGLVATTSLAIFAILLWVCIMLTCLKLGVWLFDYTLPKLNKAFYRVLTLLFLSIIVFVTSIGNGW